MTCRAPLPATDSCRTETTTTRTTTPTPTTKRQALRSGSSIGSSRTMRPSPVLLVATIFLLALFQQYTPANATTTLAFQPAAWPVSRGSAPTSTLASAALRSLCARLQAAAKDDSSSYDGTHTTATSTSPPIRPATSLPSRTHALKKNKKHQRSKKARHREAFPNTASTVLSEQELQNHVHDIYLNGHGGLLRSKELCRQRLDSPTDTLQEHGEYLKKLDRHPALVLNADYAPISYLPLSMWHWQEAIKAVFSGKVTVVDVYPDVTIRAANLEIPLPAVIALNDYVPTFKQTPAFTKRNVFLRDEYRCQYCLQQFHTRDLSLDHVVPRCKGGRLHWENAVTSCCKCNGRKGSLHVADLRQVGMKLARDPYVPTQYQLAAIAGHMVPRVGAVHDMWQPYLRHQYKE